MWGWRRAHTGAKTPSRCALQMSTAYETSVLPAPKPNKGRTTEQTRKTRAQFTTFPLASGHGDQRGTDGRKAPVSLLFVICSCRTPTPRWVIAPNPACCPQSHQDRMLTARVTTQGGTLCVGLAHGAGKARIRLLGVKVTERPSRGPMTMCVVMRGQQDSGRQVGVSESPLPTCAWHVADREAR